MNNDSYEAARRIALGINTIERRNASGIESGVKLMQDMIDARRTLGKAPTYGAATFAAITAATQRMAESMEHLAVAHEQLLAHKTDAGLAAVAFGDECPIESSLAPLLRAVA